MEGPTEWISTEKDAGSENVVFVVLAEVIAYDKRRRHVDEAWTGAVQKTVSQEQPLRLFDERWPDAADSQQTCSE